MPRGTATDPVSARGRVPGSALASMLAGVQVEQRREWALTGPEALRDPLHRLWVRRDRCRPEWGHWGLP